jgi:type IV secretory pathway VirB4 component
MAKKNTQNNTKAKEMHNKKRKKKTATTQAHVQIAEVKEDIVIMKDGTLRAVLLISSINFALKSEDEQNAIIASYVNFLNTLDFPLQIVIQSRKLNVEGYLQKLEKSEKEQTNELLRMQIHDYRQYISELIELGEIMTKKFYIVIPYNPLSDKQKGWFKRSFELFRAASVVKLSQDRFQKRKRDLSIRVDHVVGNLNSIGLKSIVLDTQSLIELYYNSYNPGVSEREKLADISELKVE